MYQATAAIHKHPLPPEWSEKAKKEIKGADPAEKLMWHTPEVSTSKYLLLAHSAPDVIQEFSIISPASI